MSADPFKDRKCEVGGVACSGNVLIVWEHQLCENHYFAWDKMLAETMAKRVEGWISKMKKQGGDGQ